MELEKIYEDVIREAFAKAEKDHMLKKKYKLSEYIADEVQELTKVVVHHRTFVNYYERYIEKKEGTAIPKHENIERLCQYLGYESYKNYVSKKYKEREEQSSSSLMNAEATSGAIRPVQEDKRILYILWVLAIVAVGWVVYTIMQPNSKNDCMIWKNDHYELVDCSGEKFEKKLDQETFKGMKQLVGLCKNTTFFLPNDDPAVWYDKYHNKLTYFTMSGIHPTNGRTLKPITQHIIDTYVEHCETERE